MPPRADKVLIELVKLNFEMSCNALSTAFINITCKSLEPVCTADIKQTSVPTWTVDKLSRE